MSIWPVIYRAGLAEVPLDLEHLMFTIYVVVYGQERPVTKIAMCSLWRQKSKDDLGLEDAGRAAMASHCWGKELIL